MNTLAFLCFFFLAHMLTDYGRVQEVGRLHYWLHTLYAVCEPWILRLVDRLVENPRVTGTRIGRALLWWVAWSNKPLPHGVVIPTSAAIHLLKQIEKWSQGEAHIAVGPCVCQKSMNRYSEPTEKDITIWYGAEIYKRTYADDYRYISAEEAAAMLRGFHEQGLVPIVEFCMQSRRWMFVLCNCDREICAPVRLYKHTGLTILPGPYIVEQVEGECLGPEECGACVTRCIFEANRFEAGRAVLDPAKCLGCGLCVTTCKGRIRRLKKRPDYQGRLLPFEYLQAARSEEDPAGSPPSL